MTVHTILQVVCLFIIYTVLTVVLPELDCINYKKAYYL